jgi:hypothetical protein
MSNHIRHYATVAEPTLRRRGWDLNPRSIAAHAFSRRAHSAGLCYPSLQKAIIAQAALASKPPAGSNQRLSASGNLLHDQEMGQTEDLEGGVLQEVGRFAQPTPQGWTTAHNLVVPRKDLGVDDDLHR